MSMSAPKSGEPTWPCWEWLSGEPPAAYAAFLVYRGLEPGLRTLENVRQQLKEAGRTQTLTRLRGWFRRWDWEARVRAMDEHAARARVERWERRRAASYERGFELSQKIHERIQQMLDHPLTIKSTRTRNREGRLVAITKIYPAKWTYSSVAQLAQIAMQVEAGCILGALASQDSFDPRTATVEECRAYLIGRGILPDDPVALPPPDPVIDIEPGPPPDDPETAEE